jgi:hypothetical protein
VWHAPRGRQRRVKPAALHGTPLAIVVSSGDRRRARRTRAPGRERGSPTLTIYATYSNCTRARRAEPPAPAAGTSAPAKAATPWPSLSAATIAGTLGEAARLVGDAVRQRSHARPSRPGVARRTVALYPDRVYTGVNSVCIVVLVLRASQGANGIAAGNSSSARRAWISAFRQHRGRH